MLAHVFMYVSFLFFSEFLLKHPFFRKVVWNFKAPIRVCLYVMCVSLCVSQFGGKRDAFIFVFVSGFSFLYFFVMFLSYFYCQEVRRVADSARELFSSLRPRVCVFCFVKYFSLSFFCFSRMQCIDLVCSSHDIKCTSKRTAIKRRRYCTLLHHVDF